MLGSYVYGSYLDEVLTLRRGATNYFLHSDAQWNTVALTDASGYPVERYEYGDYGQPEFYDAAGDPLTGSTVGNPCLFTGQRYDAETGLYWYKSRYFDPQIGRFTTRDPLGPWGDPLNLGNPYTYTGNNPWSWLDPYGLCSNNDGDDRSWWDKFDSAFETVDDFLTDLFNPFHYFDGFKPANPNALLSVADPNASDNMTGNDLYRQMVGELAEKAHQLEATAIEQLFAAATGAATRLGGAADDLADASRRLPNQLHHFASDKNRMYTPLFEEIANRYRLSLNGDWNKEVLAQLGRHPNRYHDFVLDNMRRAEREAGDNVNIFLELYEEYVRAPIRNNPNLLNRSGWE